MARASSTAEDNALAGLTGVAGGVFSGAGAAFFGANTADPGTTGASEATYFSGARAAITWGTASAGSIANATSALSLSITSSQTVSYFSTWGASSGTTSGGYQIGGALSSTITFVTNGTLSVAIGGLTITAS
jgi:hypothetical protein